MNFIQQTIKEYSDLKTAAKKHEAKLNKERQELCNEVSCIMKELGFEDVIARLDEREYVISGIACGGRFTVHIQLDQSILVDIPFMRDDIPVLETSQIKKFIIKTFLMDKAASWIYSQT